MPTNTDGTRHPDPTAFPTPELSPPENADAVRSRERRPPGQREPIFHLVADRMFEFSLGLKRQPTPCCRPG